MPERPGPPPIVPAAPVGPASFLAAAAALGVIDDAVRTAREAPAIDSIPTAPVQSGPERRWPRCSCCASCASNSPAGKPASWRPPAPRRHLGRPRPPHGRRQPPGRREPLPATQARLHPVARHHSR
ncbi:hypothetical protein ACFQ1I_03700 [Kitasatospora arboriphila]